MRESATDGAERSGWGETAFAATLFAAGAAFLVGGFGISSPAATWPRGLAAILVALMGLQLCRLVAERLRRPRQGVQRRGRFPSAGALRQVFTAVWLLGFCLAAARFGFGLSMVVMAPIYMWAMGFRRPVGVVLVTAGLAVAATYVFGTIAFVPIWEGRP